MTKVNMHEAKTHFSKLVERALRGEEVIVARNGKPLVKLVPVEGPGALRPMGHHRQALHEDFEARSLAPLADDELAAWYESDLLGD